MTTSIISFEDYFGPWLDHPDATDEVKQAAQEFLPKVNKLLQLAIDAGVDLVINPKTKNYVSGETYGGFRPQSCPIGSKLSSHKVGRGVDVYDTFNEIDGFIMLHQPLLVECGLFIENPADTVHWCHLTDRSPPSGKRVFNP